MTDAGSKGEEKTTDVVKIVYDRYIKDNPERELGLEEDRKQMTTSDEKRREDAERYYKEKHPLFYAELTLVGMINIIAYALRRAEEERDDQRKDLEKRLALITKLYNLRVNDKPRMEKGWDG